MLTRRPVVSLLLIGGGDPDCRYLYDNNIAKLDRNQFLKLNNTYYGLYVYVPWMLISLRA